MKFVRCWDVFPNGKDLEVLELVAVILKSDFFTGPCGDISMCDLLEILDDSCGCDTLGARLDRVPDVLKEKAEGKVYTVRLVFTVVQLASLGL